MKKVLINTKALSQVLRGEKGTNTPIGKAVDHHDNWHVLFVSTDQESGAIRKSSDGQLICNIRKQMSQEEREAKKHAAQTPGDVLPQGLEGFSPEAVAMALKLLGQSAQPQTEQSDGVPELIDDDLPF